MAKFNFSASQHEDISASGILVNIFSHGEKMLYLLGLHSQQQLKPKCMETLWKQLEILDVLDGKIYRNTA